MSQPDPNAPSEIEITDLRKVFGQGAAAFRALTDINLKIGTGEFFTLLGPSGCGKTTLLRVIAGFEQPTAGSVRINGKEVAGQGPNARPVNTVFQNYALFPHMSVKENIGFGLKMLGRSAAEVAETTADMLKLVQMEAMADRKPSEISGGQQQRVALARALAPKPRVLLLDEPLSALDLKLRKEMQSELKRLQTETGITFVFVTHDQEEALTMSDRIAVMSGGRILQLGAPHEIYNSPAERFVADFIGDTNFLKTEVVEVGDQLVHVRLPGGTVQPARLPAGMTAARGSEVSVVIRPEQAELADASQAHMMATVTHSVFFGTDTHIHTTLADGSPFTLRRQNAGDLTPPAPGSQIGLKLSDRALQVVRE